jgi:hypothetical protein
MAKTKHIAQAWDMYRTPKGLCVICHGDPEHDADVWYSLEDNPMQLYRCAREQMQANEFIGHVLALPKIVGALRRISEMTREERCVNIAGDALAAAGREGE